MNRPDDKWIGLLKEKLDNYSPSYNAADWSMLAKQMPATTGGQGWFLSHMSATVKTVLITGIVVVSTIVAIYISKPEKQKIKIQEKERQIHDSVFKEQPLEPVDNDKAGAKHSPDVSKVLNIIPSENNRKEEREEKNVRSKESSINLSTLPVTEKTSGETKNSISHIPEGDGHSVTRKTDNQTRMVTEQTGIKTSEDAKNKPADSDKPGNIQSEEALPDKGKHSNKTNSGIEDVSAVSILNIKLKNRPISSNISFYPGTNKLINLSKRSSASTVSQTSKKQRANNPLYLGISYSGYYSEDDNWQKHKYINLFGLTFEKYIFRNFSLSFNPKLSFNSIYKNTITDIVVPVPDDSLGITHYETVTADSSEYFSGKISFIELPLVLNYDLFSRNKYKLSASIGIAGRYTFSLSSGQLSDSLKMHNNRFTFPQAGIMSFRYRQQLKNRLFITVEPFWEFPLKREPEIFNHSYWGINICFNVEFKKRK